MNWKDDVLENIKAGLIDILILQLLTREDMYGYQLKQELYRESNETFEVKEGSLYGPLYRMLNRGLVSAHKELVGEKRFRNYYHIEKSGEEYLEYAKKTFRTVYDGALRLMNEKKK